MIPVSDTAAMTTAVAQVMAEVRLPPGLGVGAELEVLGDDGPVNTVLRSRSDVSTIHTNG